MQYSEAVQEKVLAVLMSPDMNTGNVITSLRAEYFSGERRNIFAACQVLHRESKPVDVITIFKKMKDLGFASNASKLAEMSAGGIFELQHVKHYIAELHDMYKANKLEDIKKELMADFDIPKAFEQFNVLNADDIDATSTDVHTAALNFAKKIARIKDGKEKVKSTKTHLRALDSIVNGFQPGDFVILGGRPAHGKTTLALQMAYNQAQRDTAVGFITMEMSTEQLTSRLLSNSTEIDGKKFINIVDNLSTAEITQVASHVDKLKNTKLYISDQPDADPVKIESEIARMVRQHGVEGVYIDYLQLVSPMREDKMKNKVEQVTNVSKQFKAMCKRQGVWICLISSLSRKVEDREDKRPFMADLRESGQLEYDADKVLFCYRPAAYMEESAPAFEDAKDVMEILVRKNRNGELGVAVVSTDLKYTKVTDYAPKFKPLPIPEKTTIVRQWNNQ